MYRWECSKDVEDGQLTLLEYGNWNKDLYILLEWKELLIRIEILRKTNYLPGAYTVYNFTRISLNTFLIEYPLIHSIPLFPFHLYYNLVNITVPLSIPFGHNLTSWHAFLKTNKRQVDSCMLTNCLVVLYPFSKQKNTSPITTPQWLEVLCQIPPSRVGNCKAQCYCKLFQLNYTVQLHFVLTSHPRRTNTECTKAIAQHAPQTT